MSADPFHQHRKKLTGFVILLLVILLGVIWTGRSSPDERFITIRYLLLTLSGFAAFSTPYILFPDRNAALVQLGNLKERDLIRYLSGKFSFLFHPVILLFAVIIFADLETPGENITGKIFSFLNACLLYSGILILAASRYLKSGMESQFWQESEKGREWRKKAADYLKYPLDPGAIPSLINTIFVFLSGSAAVVAGAYLQGNAGMFFEWIPGMLLFMAGVWGGLRGTQKNERHYYSANAFYREFFGTGLKGEDAKDAREVDQLWWVPGVLKAHVWQFLVQLDRKIPTGRVVASGHFLLWFIAYQRPEPVVITTLWGCFALAHHGLLVLTFSPDIAPGWLLRWLAPVSHWHWSRFWMQLRWLLPLGLGMNLQLFLFGTPGWSEQGIVLILYLFSGLILSLYGAFRIRNKLQS